MVHYFRYNKLVRNESEVSSMIIRPEEWVSKSDIDGNGLFQAWILTVAIADALLSVGKDATVEEIEKAVLNLCKNGDTNIIRVTVHDSMSG